MEIGDNGKLGPLDILEQQDRPAAGLFLNLDHRGGNLVARIHLARDGDEIFRPFGLDTL